MNTAVIAFGSNIDPEQNIKKAKGMLAAGLNLKRESSTVKTRAIDRKDDPDFLNCAVLVETEKTHDELRKYLKNVEIKLKRSKTNDKYAPRTIDLDVVIWNGKIIDDDFYKRDFLKKTTIEVLPELEC